MKKLFSIFAALLFAGSMMAETVTFEVADFSGLGAASPGAALSVTKDGVTVSATRAYGASTDLRLFAPDTQSDLPGCVLTISAETNITMIHAEFTQNTKGTFDDVEPNETSWTYTVSKQLRISKLEVTVEEAPLTDGYYLVRGDGSMVPFEENAAVAGEYVIWDIVLEMGEQLSGMLVSGETQVPLPDEDTKFTVNEEYKGRSNIYFRPLGNKDWDWTYLFFQHIFEDG